MREGTKRITKLITIILMSIALLLILPKVVNANDLTFDCFGQSFVVNAYGNGDNEYNLAWDLCHSPSIAEFDKNFGSNWQVGNPVSCYGIFPDGNDGYYMMRW